MNALPKFHWFKFSALLVFLTLLTACQAPAKQSEKSAVVKLPTVTPKYSEEDRIAFTNKKTENATNHYEGLVIPTTPILSQPAVLPKVLFYDSGIDIPYPQDGVKGVYVTADNLANPDYLNYIIDYIDQTELNAIVINFKDDYGNIVPQLQSDNPLIQKATAGFVDMKAILKKLEEHQIYPIARIVTFKDYILSDNRPDLSFHDKATGALWTDDNGAQFTNPFLPEVWDYNVAIAIEAAKMGFKDIQFDYVRFPEGFYLFEDSLDYNIGSYGYFKSDNPDETGKERTVAINDFLQYARDQLRPYGVDVSADVFGYTTIAGDAPDVRGIGQNIAQMAERVDVISSMIYPSHWGPGFFGYDYPDLYPHDVVTDYIQTEKVVFNKVQNKVVTRPWLQDFTLAGAPGTYLQYGANEVQQQINALYENGVHEYLLWNALGQYSTGVDYAPDIQPVAESAQDSESSAQ